MTHEQHVIVSYALIAILLWGYALRIALARR
jgi:hypothetical protein